MSGHDHGADALAALRDEGWIDGIHQEVKRGKEATVFRCAGGPRAGASMVAVKIYRDRSGRSFKNDAIYRAGRVEYARDSRELRALVSGSAFGREAQQSLWIHHEWEVLCALYARGVDVPAPIACGDSAIVMSFVGEGISGSAAPALHEITLGRDEVEHIADRLLDNIALMLDAHVVHGDLSSYNVLHDGQATPARPVIIDFPQAIDPRLNPAARVLLERDVANICTWARRHRVERDATAIARDLWERFEIGEIG